MSINSNSIKTHTPGPWIQRRTFKDTIFIEHPIKGSSASENVVLVSLSDSVTTENPDGSRTTRDIPRERAQANANLISAAPEMYEALKIIYEDMDLSYEAKSKLVFAIDKAEGIHAEKP